jgi:hypothetical protein
LGNQPAALLDVTIDGLDLAVSVGGQAILYPPGQSAAVAALRAIEVRDVRSVIEILSDNPGGS